MRGIMLALNVVSLVVAVLLVFTNAEGRGHAHGSAPVSAAMSKASDRAAASMPHQAP